ncbi:MAG TPA: permease-like cell division protein FtsX [Nocardioides sp.]|nr:permease-like cell division protein FtsX [Nocardioides sp.]
MTLRYVFTELRSGLRRNLTMHLAVILTIFVSLTLAGCGILLQREARLTNQTLGKDLTVNIYLCTDNDKLRADRPNCSDGEVNQAQQAAIVQALKVCSSDITGTPEFISKQQGYAYARKTLPESNFVGPNPVITVASWPAEYRVTLTSAEGSACPVSAVKGLDGVANVVDQSETLGQIERIIKVLRVGSWVAAVVLLLAALLEVANTIRLAALARRRELEIMRLVGASTLYITLPFLLEAVVTAIVGSALATGALAAIERWGIQKGLADNLHFLPWIGWHDWYHVIVGGWPPGILWLGLVLTIVPTLLLTRKYIKV